MVNLRETFGDFNAGYNEGYEQGFDAGYESAKEILEDAKPERPDDRQQYILSVEGIVVIAFSACVLLGLVNYLIGV